MDTKPEKLIMLDFDSTIASSHEYFWYVLENKFGLKHDMRESHKMNHEELAEFFGVPIETVREAARMAFWSDDFLKNVKPLPGAVQSITDLEKDGYLFKIVSARDLEEIAAPARIWLSDKGLGHIPFVSSPFGESKAPYASDCVLGMDDVPKNLEMMVGVIPNLVLMNPYDINYDTAFHMVRSWDEAGELIRKLVR